MYAARRAVILADGKSKPQHLDDRHFMEVGGEPLIVRTIRQFKGFCEDVTVICPKDFFDELPWIQGVYHALGRGMEWAFFGADMIRKGLELCIDPRTIIVFGDVYFTDEAIDIIREGNGLDWAVYGRSHDPQWGRWAEYFAIDVGRHQECTMRKALEDVANYYMSREYHRCTPWEWYFEMEGMTYWMPNKYKIQVGPHWVEINDATDDVDLPEDIERIRKMAA